ncbi:MAG: hypothetical protein K6G32_08285 [Prevotella sp.]|nr:hypothetical protein [Prevotella sp.]
MMTSTLTGSLCMLRGHPFRVHGLCCCGAEGARIPGSWQAKRTSSSPERKRLQRLMTMEDDGISNGGVRIREEGRKVYELKLCQYFVI